MADETLEILIKSVSDATGYRMNEAEAAKLKTVVAQTSTVTNTANADDVKGTEKTILSKRELRHVINALGAEAVPELSRALSALAFGGGPLAAILLLVGAFEMVRSHIKAAQQADEDFNKTAANGEFAESLQAGLDLLRSIVEAADDYKRKLEEIQKGEHSINAELEIRLALLAAIAAAQGEKAGAQKALELEKVREDEISGRITKSEAVARRAAIEKKSIEDKARADDEKFTKEQQAREAELDKAAQRQGQLQKAADEAQSKVTAAKQAQAHGKSAPTREAVASAQKDAEEAQKVFQSRFESPIDLNGPLPPDYNTGAMRDWQERVRQQTNKAALMQRDFNQAQQANSVDVPVLEHDAKAKQDEALNNLTAVAKIRDAINDANRTQTNPDLVKAQKDTRNANEQTGDLQAAGQIFENARNDIKTITRTAQGSNISPSDIAEARDAVHDLAFALNALPALLNDLKALGASAATINTMQRDIKNLKSSMPRISSSGQ